MARTFNRGTLRRMIERGELLARVDGSYTDDYRFDADTNFGKTGWLPARIRPEGEERSEAPSGFLTFDPKDFRGYGSAWVGSDNIINLGFGHRDYSFRAA